MFHSLMPKGVEHMSHWFSIRNPYQVFHSLMPKGVEHPIERIVIDANWGPVFHSLMPKGVEHATTSQGLSLPEMVFHSLMPKGVEHHSTIVALIDEAPKCFIR